MSITLYTATYTKGARCAYLLEELGLPYERVLFDLSKTDHKTPEYRRIHPLGKVPALKDGDLVVFETVAICLYLADRYPERGLAPPPTDALRGPYYQWCVYSGSELEISFTETYFHKMQPIEKQDPVFLREAHARVKPFLDPLVPAVTRGPWLLGERFSTADVLIGYVLDWADDLELLVDHPDLLEYVRRFRERPAYARSK